MSPDAVGMVGPAGVDACAPPGAKSRRPVPATRDPLTGLPNRVMLAQWLAERTGAAAAAANQKAPPGPPGPNTPNTPSGPNSQSGQSGQNGTTGSGSGAATPGAGPARAAVGTAHGAGASVPQTGPARAVTASGAAACAPPPAQPRSRAPWIGLCCLDLDGFRQINALLGFAAGDRFLAAAAERLRSVAEAGGHRLARTGGDEFAVLVCEAEGPGSAGRVAEQVLAALRQPLHVDGRAVTLTASIGAVDAPAAGSGPEDLLRAADLALYWAKGEGRDRWTAFDAERAGADVARYRLAADLPGAVVNGEFYCEYQPIVALRDNPAGGLDGAVTGVEALVRWRHPRFGPVGPDRFIGLAEESGLIVELGRRILLEACSQAATWPDAPGQPAPPVSVNVAVRQLRDPRLTGHVLAALEATGLPPERLRLEITESALLPGDDTAAAVLRSLADRGVGIAVDDFGTGYSNLAHLRRLPVDTLKIDGTFVAGLAGGRPGCPDEQIIATVTALGHALGLTVTAEGVETAEQLETVRRLGVDTGQGWLFARALPAEELRRLLARGAPLAA